MKVFVSYAALTSAMLVASISGSAQEVRPSHSSKPDLVPAAKLSADSSQEKSIKEVQAVFDRYIDGWRRADVEALSKVYAADARVTGIWPDPTLKYPVQGWPEIRKELERVFSFANGMDMAYSPRHVELYGDVAIMTTNWEWVDPNAAKPGPEDKTSAERRVQMRDEGFGQGQATFVFYHRDNRWLLVHEHASVLPADK
jgi:ketosteroid isomerase-like protein